MKLELFFLGKTLIIYFLLGRGLNLYERKKRRKTNHQEFSRYGSWSTQGICLHLCAFRTIPCFSRGPLSMDFVYTWSKKLTVTESSPIDFFAKNFPRKWCNWRAVGKIFQKNVLARGSERAGATGLIGDQAESKRASSGSLELQVSISPFACRAWPSAIATQKAHFALLAIFGA